MYSSIVAGSFSEGKGRLASEVAVPPSTSAATVSTWALAVLGSEAMRAAWLLLG